MSLIGKLLAAIGGPTGETPAEAIDLDGTNDYFSRASDFTGNADGKTFTFSAWVWGNRVFGQSNAILGDENGRFRVFNNGNTLDITALNSSGVTIFSAYVNYSSIYFGQTFFNVTASVDLTNSSNRAIYINDVLAPTIWTTYTNDTIDFTQTVHQIGANQSGALFKGRLSHVFLDYTYRDLSVEANRRLFITADRKPTPKATLQALNPILYMPMDDPTTAHINLGTGGNFTLNGVIARSGRGPNQFNVPYSDLDGASDYLIRTTPASGSKVFTFSCCFTNVDLSPSGRYITWFSGGTFGYFLLLLDNNSVVLQGRNSSETVILSIASGNIPIVSGRNYHLLISVDLTNTGKRHVSLNGSLLNITYATYSNDTIHFGGSQVYIGYRSGSGFHDGRLGNVFFDTKYIDLSVPANLAKFVTGTGIDAKPVDLGANGELPFGTPPLIYLPMYGNNAGKNYGSGGDFAVQSGPYPGARGPNEYWGNWADFNGSTGYLYRTSALSGVSDGKTFSASFFVTFDAGSAEAKPLYIGNSNALKLQINRTASNTINILGYNSAGAAILNATTVATSYGAGSFYIQICIDLSDTGKRFVYIDGVSVSITWSNYTNDTLALSASDIQIGRSVLSPTFLDGKLSEFYFTTSYIDFSQEANRLKFRDAFGNPVPLLPQIEAATIPNPAIYMRFDPADQGKNDGTGGAFTKSGTITDGGQL